ncbi:hypothetical protein Mycch_4661 [Mycolicibacterium chubuense NBB4]|uniref:Uncharacterized protein n=1 Tax=Mycolicibacterium chubuense (strain NBB4) TaxID=710421 RepID=I4BQ06_MYCCN|nr:hypothetical protein [Mycolicibacterium chubuense]AFM19363.1 hypothetical protein Mycch_4661 [Mycolicibacterium chubuense NBB4]
MEDPPLACTLSAGARQHRLTWIRELNAVALRDHRRDGARIELRYHPSAAPRVRELVRRERDCCPFLQFTIVGDGDDLCLVIEAPDDVGDGAEALLAPYAAT